MSKKIKDETKTKQILRYISLSMWIFIYSLVMNPNKTNKDLPIVTSIDELSYDDDITKDSLLKQLEENIYLNDKDKKDIVDFINYQYEYYPKNNFFKLFNNLDTIKIEYKDSFNNKDCAGQYDSYDNKIYMLDSGNNKKEVLFHELTHSCTDTIYDNKLVANKSYLASDYHYYSGVNEMFCEYFSTRDTNKFIGYQNMTYAEAIIALTGYTYDDYCNKDLKYLESLLNANGLNGHEIFEYLDEIKCNTKLQYNDEYMKKYSINYTKELKNICYQKVIEKFKDSSYENINDYIESIRKIIPGEDSDFINYINTNSKYIEDVKREKKYTYEEIKPYIIKNILLESGLVEIGKNLDLSEYDLEKIDGRLELTYNDNIVDAVSDKVSYYENFINSRQDENTESFNNRCYTINDRGYLISHINYNMYNIFNEYFDKIKLCIINEIKKENNIKEKINLLIGFDEEEKRPGLYYNLDNNKFKIPTEVDGDDIYSLYLYLNITDVFDSNFSEKYNLLYDKISLYNEGLLNKFPKYNIDNGYQLRK